MKKILMITLILFLFIPTTLLAEKPDKMDVKDASLAIMFIWSQIFTSSLVGERFEGVEVENDLATGKTSMVFDHFYVVTYIEHVEEALERFAPVEPVFNFTHISGTIIFDDFRELKVDVKLEAGNIETLVIETENGDPAIIIANGKSYDPKSKVFLKI